MWFMIFSLPFFIVAICIIIKTRNSNVKGPKIAAGILMFAGILIGGVLPKCTSCSSNVAVGKLNSYDVIQGEYVGMELKNVKPGGKVLVIYDGALPEQMQVPHKNFVEGFKKGYDGAVEEFVLEPRNAEPGSPVGDNDNRLLLPFTTYLPLAFNETFEGNPDYNAYISFINLPPRPQLAAEINFPQEAIIIFPNGLFPAQTCQIYKDLVFDGKIWFVLPNVSQSLKSDVSSDSRAAFEGRFKLVNKAVAEEIARDPESEYKNYFKKSPYRDTADIEED